MTNSPWAADGQGTYSVPGYGQLLMERNAQNAAALANIGKFAGSVGAGAIGAQDASQDPDVYGEGTTPTQAGVQGFMQNFNNAQTSAPGADMNGFSRLVNGGNGNGEGGANGGIAPNVNFKQFAAMGKVADAVRDSIKATTPTLPDQQPVVLGMNDDQWQHAGTAQKLTALQGWKQALDAKATMAGYDAGQQHMALIVQQANDMKAQAKERDAEAQSTTDAGTLMKRYAELTQGGGNQTDEGGGEIPNANGSGAPMSTTDAFNQALSEMPAGFDAGRTLPKLMQGVTAMNALKTGGNVPQKVSLDGTPVIYDPKGGNFQIDPAYTVGQKAAAAKNLLTQRLSGLSAADKLKSLDSQEKSITSDLMMTDEEKQAKLSLIDDARKSLQDGQNAGGGKRVSVTGPNGQSGTIVEGDKLPAGWQLK